VIAQSILVTGGSGSFGKAFVRRLLQEDLAERICVFSRGEHTQAQLRQDLDDDPRMRWFIGDVRDAQRLKRAMTGVDVVVHAAALKRIEVGAYNPVEMVRTNIEGTINVIEAAQDAGVDKVVGLSTDKACFPCSPYGSSKALAEALLLAANNTVSATGPRFAATRYGNVWNSAGSVVPTWLRMIENGAKAVPCTDPSATRFFMSLDQAVDLVLETIEKMEGGELVIPELPAYRLGDLAEAMGAKIIVKGMPNHEKLHESMLPGEPSDEARRMSVAELREKLAEIGFRPNVKEAA
jgi:UDP-N-acetylglucosamine 4,6-dehydratase